MRFLRRRAPSAYYSLIKRHPHLAISPSDLHRHPYPTTRTHRSTFCQSRQSSPLPSLPVLPRLRATTVPHRPYLIPVPAVRFNARARMQPLRLTTPTSLVSSSALLPTGRRMATSSRHRPVETATAASGRARRGRPARSALLLLRDIRNNAHLGIQTDFADVFYGGLDCRFLTYNSVSEDTRKACLRAFGIFQATVNVNLLSLSNLDEAIADFGHLLYQDDTQAGSRTTV